MPDCLRSLANQAYREFLIQCVLDSANDPAAEVVRNVQSELTGKQNELIRVLVAKPSDGRCSLKSNSLISALSALDEHTDVIAFADADCIVDENWLADLASPLRDPDIALSTGNRWYIPQDNRGGTLLRWLWHLAASVQMLVYRIPWGGSMAMRREFVEQSGLKEIWSSSLFEDTLLYSLARRHGKQIAVLPHMLVPNRESIETGPACRWIQRQLLNMRLYHPAFRLALLHCLTTSLAIIAALGLFCFELIWGNYGAALVIAAALLAYAVFYGGCLWSISRVGVRIIESRHGKSTIPRQSLAIVCLAIIRTQTAYVHSMLQVLVCRKTRWRGVEYLIRGPYDIQMVDYRQMKDIDSEPAERNRSIEI